MIMRVSVLCASPRSGMLPNPTLEERNEERRLQNTPGLQPTSGWIDQALADWNLGQQKVIAT